MSGRHDRWRRWPSVGCRGAAVMAAALAVLAGCSSARADLGTSDSPCYVALPAAAAAVHHDGRLLGVRLRTPGSLKGTPALHGAVASRSSGQRVCVVAFVGHYHSSSVSRPRGRPAGRLAVVVLSYPDSHVLATVLLVRPPLEFGHGRLGPA